MPLRDRPPRGPFAFLFRLPIALYRVNLGWLLGSRFLLLRHRGRRSGVWRSVVLEVVGRERDAQAYHVAAAWGERAQWFRNVSAERRVSVTVGRASFDGIATVLGADDSRRILDQYRRKHGAAMRGLQRIFGYRSFEELTASTPIVEIRRAMDDAARGGNL